MTIPREMPMDMHYMRGLSICKEQRFLRCSPVRSNDFPNDAVSTAVCMQARIGED